MNVAVKLEIFEGPLDLLLHLIRKNEVDIYDIPVAMITSQYLEYLELLRDMNIAVAGEFLVMASTLTHIKSRMLLPVERATQDEDADEDDPRIDLVAQLKEHMRMKAAADELGQKPQLGRDIFSRADNWGEVDRAAATEDGEVLIKAGLFDLLLAFRQLMQRRGEGASLDLPSTGVSLEDRMTQLLDLLRGQTSRTFEECFGDDLSKKNLVVTFLAILELTRMGLLKVYQVRPSGSQGGHDAPGVFRVYYRPDEENEAAT